MMLSGEEKIRLTEEIATSKTLKKATTSTALLKYLTKAEIANTFLKESVIEIDFFGSREGKKTSSTLVRVSMLNLRKKLNDYYATEGKDAEWRVRLDKGQYVLRYEKVKKQDLPRVKVELKLLIPYVLLLLLVAVVVLKSLPERAFGVWQALLENSNETTVFVGDYFGMKGKTVTGNVGWTRDFTMNNLQDYYRFMERHPNLNGWVAPSNYSYFTKMGTEAIHDLSRYFGIYDCYFDLGYSSQVEMDDVKKQNCIYIGPTNNENKFMKVFNERNEHFTVLAKKLQVRGLSNFPDTIMDTFFIGKMKDEIAIVSRLSGSNGTEQFFFFSNHDVGVMATVEYFTNKDSLANFTDKYLNEHKNFTALFTAKGMERTNLQLKLQLIDVF